MNFPKVMNIINILIMKLEKYINACNNLYYYCLNYRTTKNSEIYATNSKKNFTI